jgi:hypothetical protein
MNISHLLHTPQSCGTKFLRLVVKSFFELEILAKYPHDALSATESLSYNMRFDRPQRIRPAKPNSDIAIRFQDQLPAYLPDAARGTGLRCYVPRVLCTSLLQRRTGGSLLPSYQPPFFVLKTIRLARLEEGSGALMLY